jgi:hypothetical protein
VRKWREGGESSHFCKKKKTLPMLCYAMLWKVERVLLIAGNGRFCSFSGLVLVELSFINIFLSYRFLSALRHLIRTCLPHVCVDDATKPLLSSFTSFIFFVHSCVTTLYLRIKIE